MSLVLTELSEGSIVMVLSQASLERGPSLSAVVGRVSPLEFILRLWHSLDPDFCSDLPLEKAESSKKLKHGLRHRPFFRNLTNGLPP